MEVFFLVLGKKYQGWVVTGEQEEVHQDLPCGAVPSSKRVDVLKAAVEISGLPQQLRAAVAADLFRQAVQFLFYILGGGTHRVDGGDEVLLFQFTGPFPQVEVQGVVVYAAGEDPVDFLYHSGIQLVTGQYPVTQVIVTKLVVGEDKQVFRVSGKLGNCPCLEKFLDRVELYVPAFQQVGVV